MPRARRRWRPSRSWSMASRRSSRGDPARGPAGIPGRRNGAIRARLPALISSPSIIFRARDAGRGLTRNRKPRPPFARTGSAARRPISPLMPRDRANWPRIAGSVPGRSADRGAALIELSRDAANAPAMLALASPDQRNARQPVVVERCSTIWSAPGNMQRRGRSGLRCRELTDARRRILFDADFSKPEPPPPFNWALTSSTVGLAERQPGGRLHVIFYGQEDGVLASNCWSSRLAATICSMRLRGGSTQAKALSWNLTCAPGAQELWPAFRSISRRRARLDVRRPGQLPRPMARTVRVASDLPQAVRRDDRPALSLVGGPGPCLAGRASGRSALSVPVPDARRKRAGHLAATWSSSLLGLAIIAWAAALARQGADGRAGAAAAVDRHPGRSRSSHCRCCRCRRPLWPHLGGRQRIAEGYRVARASRCPRSVVADALQIARLAARR